MKPGDPLRGFTLTAATIALIGITGTLISHDHARPRHMRPLDALGLTLSAGPRPGTMVVDSLRSEGNARRAGLKVGDVVDRVNGLRATSLRAVEQDLSRHEPVDFRVRRGKTDLDVVIASR